MSMDFLELPEDIEFEELRRKVEDGIDDEWVTMPIRVIVKYVAYRFLEELEDIDRLGNKKVDPIALQKLIDDRIIRLVTQLKEKVDNS